MNTGTATKERMLSRDMPQMPWPLREDITLQACAETARDGIETSATAKREAAI